ncbi:uncharacterized protein LOC117319135 [Pecten maximus]|uniref:uncharacterized protein LOC117319135 n=1 Tax=Pecten maximus TaxID=6579 RepID=UPI001458BFD2|nr:uncharacterized protein LOC117319135 [Pecten maximus]
MAEGGLRPDSHLLECPICLEQLRQPRTLPCHHSLCQECLSSYIISEGSGKRKTSTTFTCPVCRKLTQPVDASLEKEKWAEQFPTNNAAMEMIQMKNKSTEPHYCTPCQKTKESKVPARFWCNNTQCLFCESCKLNLHDIIHANCDVVDIMTYGNFLPRKATLHKRCDKHNKKMIYYCVDHKSLGCSKCVTIGHRKCNDVTTTEEYCEKLNTDSKLEERTSKQQEAIGALESLVKDFHLQLQNIADHKDLALDSLDDLQERLVQRIREMKTEMTDDLVAKYKQESENLKVPSQKCERLKAAIQNTIESSTTAQQQNDHMDTILLYQRGQTELDACKDLIKEIRMSISTLSIEHEIDSNVTNLNFGKIVVQKERRHLPHVPSLAKPLAECEVREIRKMNMKCPSDANDCVAHGVVFIHNGLIVVGDFNNKKLKLINAAGDIVDELKMDGQPWDLCLVDNTTVAVATSKGIYVLAVTPVKLTLSYITNAGTSYEGIAFRDGEFIVSTNNEICSVTKDGKTKVLHRCNGEVYALSHDSGNGKLFIAHHSNEICSTAIGSLSNDNQHKHVLKVNVVRLPYGVDVDGEGNVYVCGWRSNNVVQLSGDGTNVRELLTAADGITHPLAISVCGDRFVVTSHTSPHCNSIREFQLI